MNNPLSRYPKVPISHILRRNDSLVSEEANASERVLISELISRSFVILKLDEEALLHVVANAFNVAKEFFKEDESIKDSNRISSKVGYKKSLPKERYSLFFLEVDNINLLGS